MLSSRSITCRATSSTTWESFDSTGGSGHPSSSSKSGLGFGVGFGVGTTGGSDWGNTGGAIGCGATCKNASAMLFVSAKVSQLALLPQGEPEKQSRVLNMVAQMDAEGFGSCTNTGACEAECPKGISLSNIARMNREYLGAQFCSEK